MASVKLLGSTYKHTQATPNTLWEINHKLGRTVVLDCYVWFQGSLQKIMPLKVEKITDDLTHIQFSTAFSGEARVI